MLEKNLNLLLAQSCLHVWKMSQAPASGDRRGGVHQLGANGQHGGLTAPQLSLEGGQTKNYPEFMSCFTPRTYGNTFFFLFAHKNI